MIELSKKDIDGLFEAMKNKLISEKALREIMKNSSPYPTEEDIKERKNCHTREIWC